MLLSGGYDSRLLLYILQNYDHSNFICATYGPPANREKLFIQQNLLKAFPNLRWINIPEFTPEVASSFGFLPSDIQLHAINSSRTCNTSHILEIWPIFYLQKIGVITDSTCVLNGQSGDFLTGAHLAKYSDPSSINVPEYINSAVCNGSNLYLFDRSPTSLTLLSNLFIEIFQPMESIEYFERQTSYVTAGPSLYHSFGLSSDLPLWSPAFASLFINQSIRNRTHQSFYISQLISLNWLHSGTNLMSIPCTPVPVFGFLGYLCFFLTIILNRLILFFNLRIFNIFGYYQATRYSNYREIFSIGSFLGLPASPSLYSKIIVSMTSSGRLARTFSSYLTACLIEDQ